MSRFYLESLSELVTITGEDALHLSKSQRKVVGDRVTVSDGKGLVAEGEIIEVAKGAVTVKLFDIQPDENEPKVKITLLQAMPKGDKPELIIQKATELGVSEVIFFLSEHCVSRPEGKAFEKKLERYQKIALEAAKQSGRGSVPQIKGLYSFREAVACCTAVPTAVLYERSTLPFREILGKASNHLNLVVGSEGGFSEQEVTAFLANGAQTATLGKRILRCETAPLAAISATMFFFEEF